MYHLGNSHYKRIRRSITRLHFVLHCFDQVRMIEDSAKCGLVMEMKLVKADYGQR